MTDLYRTSISVGTAIHSAVMESDAGKELTACFPLAVDEARLPYAVYGCEGTRTKVFSGGVHVIDSLTMKILVYAAGYDSSLRLAEQVRRAMTADTRPRALRRVILTNRREFYGADCYAQELTFDITTSDNQPFKQ